MTDDTPISYEAAARGTQLLSSAGTQIGILEHVLQVPELDVFDGIVIATKAGLCFIDVDHVRQITRRHVRCSLDDTQTAQLPPRREARSIMSMRWLTRGTASTTSSVGYSAARTGSVRMARHDQRPANLASKGLRRSVNTDLPVRRRIA